MTLTRRDRYLLALLAPLVLLALQIFWLDPGLAERRERAEASIRRQPSETSLELTTGEAERLADRVSVLKQDLVQKETELQGLESSWTEPALRAEHAVALSGLLHRHGLELSRSAMSEEGFPGLPPDRRELLKRMVKIGGAEPEIWSCQAKGAWEDLLKVLEAIENLPFLADPVALSIVTTADSDALEVTLWIWI